MNFITKIFKQASLMMILFVTTAQAAKKPNIVVILADDLGIECLSSFGGESYTTPNLDKLANQGMRFNHCFANPYCSPSRAEVLTGTYPFRNGVNGLISSPHEELRLNPKNNITIASVLQKQGYNTFIAGKWQLSILKKYDTIRDLGFDSYCCWQIFDKNNKKTRRHYNYTLRTDGVPKKETDANKYGPDELCDFIIDGIKDSHKNNKPFFAYYTSLLPHWPWVPTPDNADRTMPVGRLGDKKHFPDMVNYLDKNVGKIMKTLDELKISDNTIFIFVGDNATDPHGIRSRWKGRSVLGAKGELNDRGTRVPLIVRWPGVIKANSKCSDLVDLSDIFSTLNELTGNSATHSVHGQSFYPQLTGLVGKPRDWVFMQIHSGYYIRSKNWIIDSLGHIRPTTRLDLAPAKKVESVPAEHQAEIKRLKSSLSDLLKQK